MSTAILAGRGRSYELGAFDSNPRRPLHDARRPHPARGRAPPRTDPVGPPPRTEPSPTSAARSAFIRIPPAPRSRYSSSVIHTRPISMAPWRSMLSTELVQSVLESAPDAIVIVDGTGVIAFTNRQVRISFGYEPDELFGHPVEWLLPTLEAAEHLAPR